jgi:hypothetical protein
MGDRLTTELVDRGWPVSDVKGLMARVGLDFESEEDAEDAEDPDR